jgi:exodeoxyribonuclease VII small subunit
MENLTYSQAKNELEEIVKSIESEELDVDKLTEKVQRAAELIAFCKEKLTKADEDLQRMLDEIA